MLNTVVSTQVRAMAEEPQQKEPTVHAIVIDPTTPSTIYIGTNEGLTVSDDAGKTWTHRPFSPPEHAGALALDPRDRTTLWAATGQDLRRTRDRGVTWTTMTMPPYRVPLTVRAFAKLFDFYSDELEKGAAEFAAGKYRFASVIVVPGADPVVLAGAIGVLRSTDDGSSWHRMPIVGQHHRRDDNAGVEQLVPDPHDARTIWAVSDCEVLLSRDAGATWRTLERPTGPACVTSLAADPSAVDTLYAGTAGAGIIRSVDAGRSWTPIGGELAAAQIRLVAFALPDTLYATVQDCGLFMSTDGGRSWSRSLPGKSNDPETIAADPHQTALMYAGGYRGLWRTTDGGAHWSHEGVPALPPKVETLHLVPTAFAAATTSVVPCLGVNFSFSVMNAGTNPVVASRGSPICHAIYLSSDDQVDAGDTPLGYEFWFQDVAPDATYSMRAPLIFPLVPGGHYFVILQIGCHPTFDQAETNNVRSIPLDVGGDPTVRLTRLEEAHEQGGIGDEEYERERRELTQWFANCATPSPIGAGVYPEP